MMRTESTLADTSSDIQNPSSVNPQSNSTHCVDRNPQSLGVSVVIPTWNGRHLLEQNLPSVITATEQYACETKTEVEIIVVDDGSTDSTIAWLRTAYPQIVALSKDRNEGFGPACNHGFSQARYPVILLLNNDVRVEPDILRHLVEHFSDPSVFAVCCKALEPPDNTVATAGKVGEFKRGFWRVYANYDVIDQEAKGKERETSDQRPATSDQYYSILASGGFSAYSTVKLRALGGFNPLLAPFYWEDADLSLRAWKRGWKILYEPQAIVYHVAGTTIESHFDHQYIKEIAQRNRLIIHWINLHDRVWFLEHLFVLKLLLLSSLLTLQLAFWRAFRGAVKKLPEIRRLRNRERRLAQRSDRELADLMAATLRRPDIEMVHRQ